MREINSAELKQIQLDMLLDFAMFCDKNNLTYYLGGGTLLGAVRHKGFIPWAFFKYLFISKKEKKNKEKEEK